MAFSGIGTLEKLCLNAIANNLNRFSYAFNVTEDDHLKANFLFLQRFYSYKIPLIITKKKLLVKEQHLALLLNKYVTAIDLDLFEHCAWENVVKKITEIGQSLEVVKVMMDDKPELSLAGHTFITHIPNIKILHFYSGCTDDILKLISKHCPYIEELFIGNSAITDEGVASLYAKDENGKVACSMLRNLGFEMEIFEYSTMSSLLQNIPSLEIVDYMSMSQLLYEMHKKDIDNNTLSKVKPYNLTKLEIKFLSLSGPSLSDVLLLYLTLCPNIKCLSVPITKKIHMHLCSKFSKLESLNLLSLNDTVYVIDYFLKQKRADLRYMSLNGFQVSINILAQSCPHLDYLCLQYMSFLHKKDPEIPSFINLQHFILDGASFDDDATHVALKWILAFTSSLVSLSLESCHMFTPEIETEILNCCKRCALKRISFNHSTVKVSLLENILDTCTYLEYLTIIKCNLSSAAIENLRRIAEHAKGTPCIILEENNDLIDPSGFDHYEVFRDYLMYKRFGEDFIVKRCVM